MPPLLRILFYTATLSVLFPFTIVLFYFKSYSKALKKIAAYIFICFVIEVISTIFAKLRMNNLFLLYALVVVEFPVLIAYYKDILGMQINVGVFIALTLIFYVVAVIDLFLIHGVQQFNIYAQNTESLILILLAIISLYEFSREMKIVKMERYPHFWINTGILLYYAGSFLVFTIGNSIHFFSLQHGLYLWSINAFFALLKFILIGFGLWVRPMRSTSST